MSTSIVDRFLAGDLDAKKTYRNGIIELELSPAFATRWISDDNIAQLRAAKRIGINPDSIFMICVECGESKWATRKVSDVKAAANQFRKIARAIRTLLKETIIAVSEVPQRGCTSSSLSPLPKTAPRLSGYSGFTMLVPERFHSVRQVADEKEGLLEKCAQDLEAAIPALETVNPSHRSKHIGQSKFEERWANLVRNTRRQTVLQSQYDQLGAWFFQVTFGVAHYDALSLAKRKQRTSRSKTS